MGVNGRVRILGQVEGFGIEIQPIDYVRRGLNGLYGYIQMDPNPNPHIKTTSQTPLFFLFLVYFFIVSFVFDVHYHTELEERSLWYYR